MGSLAGGIVHDFNKLLTAITGSTGLMREDLPAGDSWRADLQEICSRTSPAETAVVERRGTSARPQVRTLFMSGYTDDTVIRQGVLEEGLPFLQKPFAPAALAQAVRDVLTSR